MTKSRFDSRLEDYEDPDETTMHEFWEAQRAKDMVGCPDPENHYHHFHPPHDEYDEPDDLPILGEHVTDMDEGDPELEAWFKSLHGEPSQDS